jgi:hypothetical protein
LNLDKFEAELLNEETIKRCITSKGNLSAPSLDRLTYLIFKYCPDKAEKLFKCILKMMHRTNKCPQYWKEGKTVMLPKSVANDKEKKRPENWRPITLMGAMYRINFGIIANYLQKINAEHNNRIISIQQKGFIKDIEGCIEHISKIFSIFGICNYE